MARTVSGAALAVVLDLAPEITEGELVEELTPAKAKQLTERIKICRTQWHNTAHKIVAADDDMTGQMEALDLLQTISEKFGIGVGGDRG